MISFLISFMIATPGFAAFPSSNGFVVGNGGDGYRIDSRILLRDLLETGGAESPEFGPLVMERHLERIRHHIWGFSFNHELLAAKISDLNVIYPHLGDAVLETLLIYNWIAVQIKLSPVQEGETLIDLPQEDSVQIANRLGSVIRLHLPSWTSMPETHQVALLIHEGLYSLVHLSCSTGDSESVCSPDLRKVREITGRLFLRQRFDSARALSREIDRLFRLPYYEGGSSAPWNPRVVNSITLRSEKPAASETLGLGDPPALHSLDITARILCEQLQSNHGFSAGSPLALDVDIRQPYPFFFTYRSPFGLQQAIAWSLVGHRSVILDDLTRENCAQRLGAEAARLQNPFMSGLSNEARTDH